MSLDELKKMREGVAKTLIKNYCTIVFQRRQRAANCVNTCDGYVTKVGKYFFITFTIVGYLPRTIHTCPCYMWQYACSFYVCFQYFHGTCSKGITENSYSYLSTYLCAQHTVYLVTPIHVGIPLEYTVPTISHLTTSTNAPAYMTFHVINACHPNFFSNSRFLFYKFKL